MMGLAGTVGVDNIVRDLIAAGKTWTSPFTRAEHCDHHPDTGCPVAARQSDAARAGRLKTGSLRLPTRSFDAIVIVARLVPFIGMILDCSRYAIPTQRMTGW